MSQNAGPAPVAAVRRWELEATQRLLGDTIETTDTDWRGPSLLPGWSRAHVATHVARNADSLRSLTLASLEGREAPLYPSAEERFAAIESGSCRTGLELQIDLDTSAGALNETWDQVTDWGISVHLPRQAVPLSLLPLARLHEVALHHIDLDCGFTADDLDPEPARWLLEWALTRFAPPADLPPVQVKSDSGLVEMFGRDPAEHTVRGSDARVWAWLTGRADSDSVGGADGISLPLMA